MNMPEWVGPFVVEQIKKYMPLGYPEEGTDRIYLLPRDLRDLWTTVISMAYFDSEAFHSDRFLDRDNPSLYKRSFDISDYTYSANRGYSKPDTDNCRAFGSIFLQHLYGSRRPFTKNDGRRS